MTRLLAIIATKVISSATRGSNRPADLHKSTKISCTTSSASSRLASRRRASVQISPPYREMQSGTADWSPSAILVRSESSKTSLCVSDVVLPPFAMPARRPRHTGFIVV